MTKSTKIYLGDGVYAEFGARDVLILTTENGEQVTNTVFLEPFVLVALLEYIKKESP